MHQAEARYSPSKGRGKKKLSQARGGHRAHQTFPGEAPWYDDEKDAGFNAVDYEEEAEETAHGADCTR